MIVTSGPVVAPVIRDPRAGVAASVIASDALITIADGVPGWLVKRGFAPASHGAATAEGGTVRGHGTSGGCLTSDHNPLITDGFKLADIPGAGATFGNAARTRALRVTLSA